MIIQFGNSIIDLKQSLSTDLSYSGIICSDANIAQNSIGFGCLLYLGSNSQYYEANANSDTTMPVRAFALTNNTGITSILLNGFVRNDSWNLTTGNTIYCSDSIGLITDVPPSGVNYQIQPVGYAIDTNIIYFNPSLFIMTITI